MTAADATPGTTAVEALTEFRAADLADLCDAAETAIVEGGGFGWLTPPPRDLMERFWKGVLLVPERELWVGRLDGRIAGSVQLVRAPRNNEAQAKIATVTTCFVAPWGRRRGIGRALSLAVEQSAHRQGFWAVGLDIRETQAGAIRLYESLGYECWGKNPNYAVVDGRIIAGRYYTKRLRSPRGSRTETTRRETA